MKLYHYTSPDHLPPILRDGFLKVTESNLHPTIEHHGPDVVWLTTDDDLSQGDHGLISQFHDKKRIRFTVDVPKSRVHKWKQWALDRNIDKSWLATLLKVGGGSSWRITTSPISQRDWVEIYDMKEGRVLWTGPS